MSFTVRRVPLPIPRGTLPTCRQPEKSAFGGGPSSHRTKLKVLLLPALYNTFSARRLDYLYTLALSL